MDKYSLSSLQHLAGGRDVYIYGASHRGLIWRNFLQHREFNVRGYIDQNKKGNDIYTIDDLTNTTDKENIFIIVAAQNVFAKQIMETLDSYGYLKDVDYVNGSQFYNQYPTIEVAGLCNLKCISCNLGSDLDGRSKGGFMSLETYKILFKKLLSEITILPNIALYCWGEPLLNPALPSIIRHTLSLGVCTEISTNLNSCKKLEEIIKESPTFIKVSCSGIGEHYERMHTGGKWSVFLENMHKLRQYIDQYNADTKVAVIFHAYKDNLDEDYDFIENLASELGFSFEVTLANVFPESIYKNVVHGKDIPQNMLESSKGMIYSIKEQIEYSQANRKSCLFMSAFPTIRWDGAVLSCCNMEGGVVAENFMDVPQSELKRRQVTGELCTNCMKNGLQRLCSVTGTVEVVDGTRTIAKL